MVRIRGVDSRGRSARIFMYDALFRIWNMSDVPGLERGIRVLRLFSRTRRVIGQGEMARELEIPRSPVHRLVTTLERLGFLRRTEAAAFALGPGVLTLGFEYLHSLDLVELSTPVLQRL
jgi:DNA-binding IclR family transcriptional regulator